MCHQKSHHELLGLNADCAHVPIGVDRKMKGALAALPRSMSCCAVHVLLLCFLVQR